MKISKRISEVLSGHDNVGGVMVPFSAYCLMILYICTSFMKISQRVFELLRGHKIMTDGQTDGQMGGQTR